MECTLSVRPHWGHAEAICWLVTPPLCGTDASGGSPATHGETRAARLIRICDSLEPTQHNVHEVAQDGAADTATVYVDNDPVVLVHANALLAGDARTAVVAGDVRDPAGILRDAAATGLLDFARPVCLLLVAVLHFVPDADDPAALMAAFRDALAPGSYLILSHATMDGYPAEAAADSAHRAGRVYDRATSRLSMRDRAEVGRLLAGFDLVEPGLVHVTNWRSAEPPRARFDPFLGAVGVRS